MTDQEQLAGYDENATDKTQALQAPEPSPGVPAASSPELRTLVAVAVGAIVVATLYMAQDVLVPITLAVMLSFVLSPFVDVLARIGLRRAPAVAVSMLVALGAIGLIGGLLGNQAATLAADVPHYVEAVQSKVERIQLVATTRAASITRLLSGGKPATVPVAALGVPPRALAARVESPNSESHCTLGWSAGRRPVRARRARSPRKWIFPEFLSSKSIPCSRNFSNPAIPPQCI